MRIRKISQHSVSCSILGTIGAIVVLLCSGCGTPHMVSLAVSPARASIALGETAKFAVVATFSDGTTEDVTAAATWSTANTSIATVNAGGVASPVSLGTATIVANAYGKSGSASLVVSKAPLKAITVTSPGAPIALGQTAQLQAQGTYSDKSTQDITDQVTWASAQPSVATISSTGLAASKSVGSTQVTASLNNISASGNVTVAGAALASIAVGSKDASVPLGVNEQFSAIGTYTDGRTADLTSTATWTSSAPAVVSINGGGAATTKAVGGASISAAVAGMSGMTQFAVTPAALVSIAVSAAHASLALGTSEQLTATGTFTDGSSKDITTAVSWSSSAPGVLSVSSGGAVTAKATGSAGISAVSASITANTSLSVSAAALVSISVSASHASLPVGSTEQLTATGTFTDNTKQDISSSVTWSSSVPAVASISSRGAVVGKAVGSAALTASSSGVTGSTNLGVSAAALVGINISAARESIPLGDTLQLSAIGTLTDGTTQDMTGSVNWTSSSPDVLSVRAGLVAGLAVGAAGVTASSGSISAVKSLNVSAPALSSIQLAPAGPTVPLGSSLQLTITGTFTDGSTQDVTQQVSWNIDAPGIAAITSGGMVSGQQVGTTGVEATLDGLQASDTLTVQPLLAVGYFDATSGIDSTIRVTNPGTTGQDLCTMIYVFDQDQQMSECCGCLVTQDGLLTLSLKKDLLSNPLTGVASTTGTVMLVSGKQLSTGGCNAASVTPAGTVSGWVTHLPQSKSGTMSSSETPFSSSPLSTILSSSLQAQCSFIQQLGSGQGLCGCGSGQH